VPKGVFLLVLIASGWGTAVRLATVTDPDITESSGVVASRRYPGWYWTHNDSGDGPRVFLFDLQGTVRARVTVEGANAIDWEDIAMGPGPRRGAFYLYAGDIGDNERNRHEVQVYRFAEPTVGVRAAPGAERFRFRYPDRPHDAEALLVHPKSGDLYIVTKAKGEDTETLVFKAKAPLRAGDVTTLARVASLHFPGESPLMLLIGRVTGGDVAPDGRRLMLCDYQRGWEYTMPAAAMTFDDIWGVEPSPVDLGQRKQGESVCYRLDGQAVIATSEGTPMPIFQTLRER
jgi:hypothetical protein